MTQAHASNAEPGLVRFGMPAQIGVRHQEVLMNKHFSRARDLFSTIGAAIAVAGAVDVNRRPTDRQLRGAGIDPKAFDAIFR